MANDDNNTTGGNSTGGTDLGLAFSRLRNAVTDPNNRSDALNRGKGFLARTMDGVTGAIKVKTPEEKAAEEKERLRQKQIQDEAAAKTAEEKKKQEEAADQQRRQQAATGNKPDETKKEGEKAPEEDINWVAKGLLTILPQGAKDWAAAASVPMITGGQKMIAELQAKGKKLKVTDDVGAYISCMTDKEITTIPKAVHDYAKVILNTMGLGANEEMVNALSVGFIGWLRQQVSGVSMGMVSPVKGFNVSAGSLTDMLTFGKDPVTLANLFGFAPRDQAVDPQLLDGVKGVFSEQGVTNIETYFPGNQMSYGQFVGAYAQMGHDMVASGKWQLDASKLTDQLREAAEKTLEKAGVTDVDGSLRDGLAMACLRGADFIKAAAQPARPGATAARPDAPEPVAH